MSQAVQPAVITCEEREDLFHRFRERLRTYQEAFAELLADSTVELAAEKALPLFEACVAARCEWQKHKKLHECSS
jgi:hypothetical protein